MIEFILSAPFVLSVIILMAISIAVLLEFEKDGWATTCFSLGVALTLWAYKLTIWTFISTSPMTTVYFCLSYIAAGLVWSLFKWKYYVGNKLSDYNTFKDTFIKTYGSTKGNWKEWINKLNSQFRDSNFHSTNAPEDIADKIIPKANSKKSLIVSWISYWPMSLGATLLNNPFRKFFEWIYSLVSGIYDKIGSNASASITSGIEKPSTEK